MKYTVVWRPAAEDDLAAIWLAAEDRKSVTHAARQADELLRNDPLDQGESRSGPIRILFVPPLGIEFEAVERDRRVHILTVWKFRPGKSSA
jgi:plasmid stabilization system protein ParE